VSPESYLDEAALYFILRSIIPKLPLPQGTGPNLIHGSWKLDPPDPRVHPNSSSITSAVLQKYSDSYKLTAERLNSLLNSSKFLVTSNYVINVGIPAILPISIYNLTLELLYDKYKQVVFRFKVLN